MINRKRREKERDRMIGARGGEREKSTNRPLVFGVIVGELVVKMGFSGALSASHVVLPTN